MKKISFIIMAILLCFSMTGSDFKSNRCLPLFRYSYPIDFDSEEWFDYTVLEKSSMLMIPQTILDSMSDIELLYAIADYPYFGDLYLYGFDENGLAAFAEYCSAFKELQSRQTFLKSLNAFGRRVAQYYASDEMVSFNDLRAGLILDLMDYFTTASEQSRDTPIFVYTPNGTAVSALLRDEPHDGDIWHYSMDQLYIAQYSLTLVSPGTCLYNCHAYAWSLQSINTPYWIPNPGAYMSDGSYIMKYSGPLNSSIANYGISQGDIVFYQKNNKMHSAVLTGNTTGGAPLASIEVVSKWAEMGLFKHSAGNLPASWLPANVTIWHLQ